MASSETWKYSIVKSIGQINQNNLKTHKIIISMKLVRCCGGGMYFWFQYGVLTKSQLNDNTRYYTISSGTLAVVFYLSGIKIDEIIKSAKELVDEYNIISFHQLNKYLFNWLDKVLPKNIHELCNGQLNILTFDIKSLSTVVISEFHNRQILIDGILSSINLPVGMLFFRRLIKTGKMDHLSNSFHGISQFDIDINPFNSECFSLWNVIRLLTADEALKLYNNGMLEADKFVCHNNGKYMHPYVKTGFGCLFCFGCMYLSKL